MIPIDSKHIAAVEYDEETNTLTIEFRAGQRYKYFELPSDVYQAFLDSDSKSEFFRDSIKSTFTFMRTM